LFDEYTESGYIVGEDNNPESRNIEMAINQNEIEDTSCAINEDEEEEEEGDASSDDENDDAEDNTGEEGQFEEYKDKVVVDDAIETAQV
jgi:hypothetical protein